MHGYQPIQIANGEPIEQCWAIVQPDERTMPMRPLTEEESRMIAGILNKYVSDDLEDTTD